MEAHQVIGLRPHQQQAYDAACTALQSPSPRAILKLFCGSGKTRVLLRVALAHGGATTLIVFPSIRLLRQFRRDYMERADWAPALEGVTPLYVCSAEEVVGSGSKKRQRDGGAFTTDPSTIRTTLSGADRALACVTYASLSTFADAASEEGRDLDLALFDEAHHCTAAKAYALLTEHEALATVGGALFFTATPSDDMLADEETFGEVAFDYTYAQAVADGVCNATDIVVEVRSTDEARSDDLYDVIVRTALATGNTHVLVFHTYAQAEGKGGRSSVKQYAGAEAQAQFLRAVARAGTEAFTSTRVAAVTATSTDRDAVIDAFEASGPRDLFILHSCQVLGEGVDTSAANMVVFADPRQSPVVITQNIGRATRKPRPDMERATILLPVALSQMDLEAAGGDAAKQHALIVKEMRGGAFESVLNTLAALRQEDPDVIEELMRFPPRHTGKAMRRAVAEAGLVPVGEPAGSIAAALGVTEVGRLEDLPAEVARVSAALGRRVEVQTGLMDGPALIAAGDGEVVRVLADGAAGTFQRLEPAPGRVVRDVKPPVVPVRLRVRASPAVEVAWHVGNLSGVMGDAVRAAYLECDVMDGEERMCEKAREVVARARERGGGSAAIMPKQHTGDRLQLADATFLTNRVQQLRCMKCYESVAIILDDGLGIDWRLAKNGKLLRKVEAFVKRAIQRGQLKNGRVAMPIEWQACPLLSPSKFDERTDAIFLYNLGKAYRQSSTVRCNPLPADITDLLDNTFGEQWRLDGKTKQEQTAIRCATQVIERATARGNGIPTVPQMCKSRLQEYADGKWLARLRITMTRGTVAYHSVIGMLDGAFGPAWRHRTGGQRTGAVALIQQAEGVIVRSRCRGTGVCVLPKQVGRNRASASAEKLQEEKDAGWLRNVQNRDDGELAELAPMLDAAFGQGVWRIRRTAGNSGTATTLSRSRKKQVAISDHVSASAAPARSPLETYHQRFKTMRADTYSAHVAASPAEWHDYHRVAAEHDARDPPERRVLARLATALAAVPPGRTVVDLGCGTNGLKALAPHLIFTSVDAVASDASVVAGDLAALPADWSDRFHVAILSRALWATNKEAVLAEALRVLRDGGQLLVVESFAKWWDAEAADNRLVPLLVGAGFTVESEFGTRAAPDAPLDVFGYYVCRKPVLAAGAFVPA